MTTKEQNLPRWDLTDLYPSPKSKELAADQARLKEFAQNFHNKYEGKVEALSGAELGAAIKDYEEIVELLSKIGSYSGLLFATKMLDADISAFYQNISEALNDVQSDLLFFTLAINKIEDAALNEKMHALELMKYKPWVMDLRVMKPHQLSDELEKFDLEKSVTANSNWSRLFDETHAGLKYNFRGEEVSNAGIFDKFHSPDRQIRKDAGEAVAKTLGDNIKLFTLITNTLAKDKATEDKWRNFKKPISSRNLANLVEDEVVDALISTVKKNYGKISHRYYKWKAKQLGLKKMEYWDRNAPLTEFEEEYIPYKRGVEITLDAYGKFSPKILEVAKKFFENAWIDVPPEDGKDSGAFAHPCATSVHPYLLLNYQGKTRDVMTLAHELGHGVHQYLSRSQGALMADTPLTLAETASVFGEQLVFRYMLEMEKDPVKKKIMIAKKVEDMINTLIRQISFCEFERKVHEGRKFGELTPDDIGNFWLETQRESLGDIFNFTNNGYRHFWSYIPHFIHTPFYVYAYGFGDSLVNSLYGVYLSGLNDFENKYLELLKTGGAKRHKELLAPFGLDASDFSFWQKGIDIIDDFITQLEK